MERQYMYIKAIAEQGSILKAAERMYVTPSALSKHVQKMESALGVKLFDRVGKKFVLTYPGERYLYWQERMLALRENMDEEMDGLANARRGRLRVGLQVSDSKLMLRCVLPVFYQEFPGIKLELYEDSSRIIRGLLEDNVIDFAVLFDYKLGETIRKHMLIPSNRVLVVPKGSPVEKKAVRRDDFPYPWIDLRELKDEKFIVPLPNQHISSGFDEFREECGFELQEAVQAKFLETRLTCAAQGLGITYADDHIIMANFSMERLTLLSYGRYNKVARRVIAYNRDHYMGRAHRRLIELYDQAYENLLPIRASRSGEADAAPERNG